MTVLRADVWQLKPGRLDDAIAITKDATAFITKFGGRNHHLSQLNVGSENTSLYITVSEWDSYVAHGRQFVDASATESEWQAILARIWSPDAPATHLRTQLGTEVAHFGPRNEIKPGTRNLVRFWEVLPGRMDEFKDIVSQVSPFVERFGVGTTLYRLTVAGQSSNHVVSGATFPDMGTLGAYLDTLESDPKAQQLAAKVTAENSPARQLTMRIDTVIV